ncbi:MAG: hypothetical protein QM598_04225 [Protaetiibacter sp.]
MPRTNRDLERLARACWSRADEAWDEVRELTEERDRVPELIRALAAAAPEGALSYIGVTVLEDIAMDGESSGAEDGAIDALLAAELDLATSYEILSGPYPELLGRWQVRERFAHLLTPAQLDALFDWAARVRRRIVLDEEGTRLLPLSGWFDDAAAS